jgi:hypothetical protein
VAITLGAGGIGIVSATVSSGDRTVFVPVEPCRIIDTRPGFVIGPRTSPLGADETHPVTAHGTNGQCTLPNDATGLALNVTATDASNPTFLAIWGDGTRPNASSLNPTPGQPPTPNAVTTDLTASGQFNIFNKQGNVNVFVDVVGYYANHNHNDLYYTKTKTDSLIDAALTGGASSRSITINPLGMDLQGSATVPPSGSPQDYGVVLPDSGAPFFAFGFTIPTDYTRGSRVEIQILWHTNQPNCTFNLDAYSTSHARRGEQVVGFTLDSVTSIEPVNPQSNELRRKLLEVNGGALGIQSGDTFLVQFLRSIGDSCSDDVIVTGVRVRHS